MHTIYHRRVHSPTGKPVVLCLRPHRYKAISYEIRQIFYQITKLVEPLSLDEVYLDITDVMLEQNSSTRIAQLIKEKIFKRQI